MRTPANIAGHPIHPMLVTIPIGLWIFSLVADIVALRSSSPETWAMVALYTLIGGIVGALLAALPGLVDLLSLQDRAIKKTALVHMTINLAVVAIYVVNAMMRWGQTAVGGLPLILSIVTVGMLVISGWLGGKMVYLGKVGVSEGETATTSPAGSRAPDRRHA